MYAKDKVVQGCGQQRGQHPLMTSVKRPENQSQHSSSNNPEVPRSTHYDAIQVDPLPLSHLRDEDGGYLGPAALNNMHLEFQDDPSPSQSSNIKHAHLNNNNASAPSNLPVYDAGRKPNQRSFTGAMDVDSSSYQSETNRGTAVSSFSWRDRTGCEQILLMGAAILLMIIVTLAAGISVLKGISTISNQYVDQSCQSRACVKAAGQILESLDESIDPCEDFVHFACGGWYATHPVPEATYRWSMLDILDENTLYELKHLLEEKPDDGESNQITAARKVYQACTNDSRWSEVGLSPLLALMDEVGGLPMIDPDWSPTGFHLEDVLAWIRKAYGQTLVTLFVSPDMHNISNNAIYVDEGILPMPAKALVYASATTKVSRTHYMMKMGEALLKSKGLGINGTLRETLEKDVNDMWEFTVELAKITAYGIQNTNPWATYNPMTVDELSNITNHDDIPFKFDWLAYLVRTFNGTNITIDGDHHIIVQHKTYFQNLTRVLNRTTTRTIANFLVYQMVDAMAEESSSSLRELHETFEGLLWKFGRTSLRAWHNCAGKTRILLRMAVGQLYFKKHSLASVTDIAKKLVSDVSDSFRTMLTSATWMSNNTAQEAIKKLDNMLRLVAYPDFFFDDNEMDEYWHGIPEVSTTDHFGNIMSLSRWHGYKSLAKLKKPPSRTKWPSGPLEINAFHAALQNTIVIPGGVMQPPVFYHDDMAALNYGGLGAIIGHEITHGFDNNGRHFDWRGDLAHWWDNHTMMLYVNKSKCFEEQYSSYNVSDLLAPFETVDENLKINGITSKGENIADNGGMRAAWLAYKNHVSENQEELILPGLQKYNQDQLFFISFSRLWCMQFTPWALTYTVQNDNHPPGHFRILGALQNSHDFAEAFSCDAGTKMNPTKKCVLW